MKFVYTALFCLMLLSTVSAQRQVAITIDDLPVVSTRTDLRTRREITKKLLGHIKKAKIPAIGFVNENKLYNKGERDPDQIALLEMWLDAGLELGNHTYSHMGLHSATLKAYEEDLLKGETITKELLEERGRKIRYFRHPYLHTGRTVEIKNELGEFLKEHGYTIAPISFDNADYIFSRAYDVAYDRHDKKLMKKVGDAYVPYMKAKLEYWERQSVKLFGREIPQTLLIHANFINSEYLDDLAKMFKERGYKFVDLDTALKDEAYSKPDRFYGASGISWLHRWALEEGREKLEKNEPHVPDFVLKLSGFESE
jgi:peptidoglycan/xylan/chitin deacetylase (PgdA/CDA1 family)